MVKKRLAWQQEKIEAFNGRTHIEEIMDYFPSLVESATWFHSVWLAKCPRCECTKTYTLVISPSGHYHCLEANESGDTFELFLHLSEFSLKKALRQFCP